MHLQIPKPLHGWRQFAGEVGIIVLGVLIALGAQQVVATLQQKSDARDAEHAIRDELETNMARMHSRQAVRACVDRRLDELQALIDSAGPGGGSIETPKWVGRPQFWTMQMSRWDATSQAGRAALIPADALSFYGAMYSFMSSINAEGIVEQDAWARLRSLEHVQRLTPEMTFQLQNDVQQARYINWRMQVWTVQLQALFDRAHLRVVPNNIPASRSACIPMSTPREQAIRESNSFIGEEP
jgi:hypothetical protein